MSRDRCCILSKFYIKPQHGEGGIADITVVSYRNSTSNHNEPEPHLCLLYVVSYRNSTSNHNSSEVVFDEVVVVSYRNSTSNHNNELKNSSTKRLYLIEILHQTTTLIAAEVRRLKLYLIEILHQTTTVTPDYLNYRGLYLIEILHQTTTRRALRK